MKKSVIILVLVMLFSCNQKEKQQEKSKQDRVVKVDKIKSKYGIKYSMTDLFDFKYTYQFNPVINENKQLLEYYNIQDIYSKGDQNFVKLNFYKYYFDLLVEDQSILKALLDDEAGKGIHGSEDFLIIKLDEIRKIDFLVDVYDDSYKNDVIFFMEVIENENFIGRGKIIQIIHNE